jgi:hypothetical protein
MEATPERDEIIDFIRNSSWSMKGYSGTITHPSPPEGKECKRDYIVKKYNVV